MDRVAGILFAVLLASPAVAQTPEADLQLQFVRPQGPSAPPELITLQDALERARKVDTNIQTTRSEVELAREDMEQARAARFPSVGFNGQYAGTQGNGITPSGRYVGADGVHVYRSAITVHQEISPNTLLKTEDHRAAAAKALATARAEVALRGIDVAVTERYYGLVAAQRRYSTTQLGVEQAQRFLQTTQERERGGEAARSDVVKAELQLQQQRRGFAEASLDVENSRLNLAVLLSTGINENFTIVDDLNAAKALPAFEELRAMAERENPELKVANAALQKASLDIRSARNLQLPALSIDAGYGIEANAFKLHSTRAAEPELGVLPNLGYSLVFNLSIPIFDWGTNRSRIRQAETRERQAGMELNQSQRQMAGNLYAFYNEALAARTSVELARTGADLAAESLRLINLRYQSGDSSVFEVVEAQNTLIEARSAFDESQIRYRMAVASLQSVTGGF